ncbi:50S ribosomal protein L30 [Coxiella endosymbiont of Ornithodoros maritimus]|uniref:50S ribosomal protein L30 n=1 Tax=Coxiella endosymbiont of Ornithodoros maritimus TaxID=1656172 RepID=UPI002264BBC2|nr:50S ribosomal protein L30 [Coxiella endosymbiont of Ornithodoros maritimus]
MLQEKKLRVTLVKSKYGRKPRHRECIEGLGLRRMHQTVEVADTAANRGMIDKVSYLLMIDEEV